MIDKDGSISKTLKNTESPSPTGVDLMTNLASHPPTILLVDDSKTVRHMLAITLQEAGFWTLQAVDGKEAIAQLRNHAEVQLVVCDLEMPNMNGLEFLTYRRQDSLLSLVPVVMLSFRDDRRYKQLAMQLGATAYFTKPYVEKEFIATLRVILHSNN
jgi:CheY-like chemotaxis protein